MSKFSSSSVAGISIISATCDMCSKATVQGHLRWYQYDNGEQFRATVCGNCAAIHDQLIKKTS